MKTQARADAARRTLFLLAALSPMWSQASGQQPASTDAKPAGVCWRPRPMSQCTTIILTEFAYTAPLISTTEVPVYFGGQMPDEHPVFRHAFAVTFGLLRNDRPGRATGFSISGGIDARTPIYPMIEARRRYWHDNGWSYLDVSAGYTHRTVEDSESPSHGYREVTAPGLTASVTLAPVDFLTIVARGDAVFTPRKEHYGLSLGARTGSYGTAGAALGMVALVGALLVALSQSDF